MPDGVFGPWLGAEGFCESWEEGKKKRRQELGIGHWDFTCWGKGKRGREGPLVRSPQSHPRAQLCWL